MKHLLSSMVCILILFIPWLLYENYSNSHIENYNTLISREIIPSIDSNNWDKAEKKYILLQDDWEKFKNTSEYFLDSESINEVDETIYMTYGYIKLNDSINSVAYISKLRHMLNQLHDSEKLSLDNIL